MGVCAILTDCFTGTTAQTEPISYEKAESELKLTTKSYRTVQETAADVLDVLFSAEKKGKALERDLDDLVSANSWTESLAEAILSGLEKALQNSKPMGQAMKEAFDRAVNEAVDFAKDHPVFCTVIALGILVYLVPWVVEAIGFGGLGPIEGSWAALWQSRYAGYVPKKSLFSYFQRLGMKWKMVKGWDAEKMQYM